MSSFGHESPIEKISQSTVERLQVQSSPAGHGQQQIAEMVVGRLQVTLQCGA